LLPWLKEDNLLYCMRGKCRGYIHTDPSNHNAGKCNTLIA
jgi:hypothetical protein